MFGRTIIHEHGADDQIRELGIGFERYDDLSMAIEWALLRYPEMFPIIQVQGLVSARQTNLWAESSAKFLRSPSSFTTMTLLFG